MVKTWTFQGKGHTVTLSGAYAPSRIEFTNGRVHKDIQILDRTAYIIDSGTQIPEIRLEGWVFPLSWMTPSTEDVLSAMNALVYNNISCVCNFPNDVPTADQDTLSDTSEFSVAEWSFEEEGGAPSHYRWEMSLRRIDTRDMIPVKF